MDINELKSITQDHNFLNNVSSQISKIGILDMPEEPNHHIVVLFNDDTASFYIDQLRFDTLDDYLAQVMIETPGQAKILPGVFILTQAQIIAEQDEWSDVDESKAVDFTTAPYWITTDSGDTPTAVHTADDLSSAIF